MRKLSNLLFAFLLTAVSISSYQLSAQSTDEFKILVDYLEANGNYINTEAPSMIMATEINENLKNKKYLVIDIRKDTDFDKGHIKGAINLKSEELIKYFDKKIKPENFEKISIVCYSGQSAAYYTAVMRLLGYNNVYTLKWGMSSWGKSFAQNIWTKNTASTYVDKLETKPNPMSEKSATPVLTTGKTDAKEILKARADMAIATVYRDFITKPEDVFANPTNYYIVSYWNEEKYNNGHIPGSVRYEPKKAFNFVNDLTRLPKDKRIIVYSDSGHTSAFITAFLHMLGYNVGHLAYGANGYMNNILVKKGEGWNAFSPSEINEFPVATKELTAPGCD
ncbi:MAG TPA: rhodanese-like domain-containing protein [Flavobacteriaceae bacterium]|nr:rhodanese-like domain-containing protein [Flavobacteriaceae bacterium]HEX5743692.1 rhodanese-like domain-containing protein [Flavobacteriaceae bacterium]